MGRMADSQASFLQYPETKVDIQGRRAGRNKGICVIRLSEGVGAKGVRVCGPVADSVVGGVCS